MKQEKGLVNKIVNSVLRSAIFGQQGTEVSQRFPGEQLSQTDTLIGTVRGHLISNNRALLAHLYVENGLIRTIVDIPVDDGLSGVLDIKTGQLDDGELESLRNQMEREGDIKKLGQALKWSRLYGGGGILILVNEQPHTEFKVENIKKDDEVRFRHIDLWELYFSHVYHMEKNDEFGGLDHINPVVREAEIYNFYGNPVHTSRVLKIIGEEAPSYLRSRLRGWGLSIIEHLIRPLNQYMKSSTVSFDAIDEFKIDVYGIMGFTQTLDQPGGNMKIRERIQLANQQKNFQNAVVMDSEDTYTQKTIPFQGLGKVIEEIRTQLAAELRMPQTKLFGITPSGFNAGSSDIENYNKQIESGIRSKIKFLLLKIIEIRCQQLFGHVPDDLDVEFEPLKVLGKEEEENIKNLKMSRVERARQSGEISASQYKESMNKEDLLPIKLDVTDKVFETPIPEGGVNDGLPTKAPKKTVNEKKKTIVVVGLMAERKYLLSGKRRDNGLWVSPGGHVNPGEDLDKALMRECYEEAGIDIQSLSLRPLPGKETEYSMVYGYIVNLPERIMARTLEDPDLECETWQWFNIEDNPNELKPEYRHAKEDVIIEYIDGLKNRGKNRGPGNT